MRAISGARDDSLGLEEVLLRGVALRKDYERLQSEGQKTLFAALKGADELKDARERALRLEGQLGALMDRILSTEKDRDAARQSAGKCPLESDEIVILAKSLAHPGADSGKNCCIYPAAPKS